MKTIKQQIPRRDTDEHAEFRQARADERRRARRAAKAFVDATRCGDVGRFLVAVNGLNLEIDAWRLAMRGIGRLSGVSADIQAAFLSVWVESKHLPLRV